MIADPETDAPRVCATPFVLRDPSAIPRRQWLYGRHLIRRFVSVTVAPGGVGKSTLAIGDALSIVTGRPLLGSNVWGGPCRAWVFNLEDPADEIERRIAAAALHHGIGAEDIEDRLFADSGRDQPLRIAEQTVAGGARIIRPVVDALVDELRRRRIDVMMIDPFVSSHAVTENDNGAIDLVAKAWGAVADAANCAIELVHHSRKNGGAEVTAEDARGAGALVMAARTARVLNRMTKEEAQQAGIPNPRAYFSTLADKANLAPVADRQWFRLVDVELANGDHVGVVEPWQWPDAFDGLSARDLLAVQTAIDGRDFADNVQAADWVGFEVGRVLRIDVGDQAGKIRVRNLLRTWIGTGALRVEHARNEASRKMRPVVRVGAWAVVGS